MNRRSTVTLLIACMVSVLFIGGAFGQTSGPATNGLECWYAANSMSLSNYTQISTWVDSSGTGNNLFAPAGSEPWWINNGGSGWNEGQPAVHFGYDSSISTSGFSSSLAASAFTIFIVTVSTLDGTVLDLPDAGTDSAEIWSTGSNSFVGLMHWTDSNDYTAIGATQAPVGTGPGQIIEARMGPSASDITIFINGVQSMSAVQTVGSPANFLALNRELLLSPGNALGGTIQEILIYTQELTSAAENQTGSYLATKYGLTTAYVTPAPVSTPSPSNWVFYASDSAGANIEELSSPVDNMWIAMGNGERWMLYPPTNYAVQPGQVWTFSGVVAGRNVGWMNVTGPTIGGDWLRIFLWTVMATN